MSSVEIQWVDKYIYSLTGLTPTHFCVCSIHGPGFPMPYVMVFFAFFGLRSEVVNCFVDISGIVDHHYLNFFIIDIINKNTTQYQLILN